MERLPRGRHGLTPEYVAAHQRQRLIAGLIESLHEVGYEDTTVSSIGRRAAVSKSDFYKHFENKEACFLAAYEDAVRRVREPVLRACAEAAESEWPLRVRDGIAALLALLAAEPALASIVLVEGLRAGRDVGDRYLAAVASFVPCLSEGVPPAPGGAAVPEAAGEAVAGGIASLLGRRVLAGEAAQLGEMLPELLEFALAPYLGAAAARRIVSSG